MWNPLMRFLLFLDYPHIVSARQPGVGQASAGGEHCQGGRQAPVLNSLSCLPVFENLDQVNDQNRCMQAPNKIHSCLQNLLFNALVSSFSSSGSCCLLFSVQEVLPTANMTTEGRNFVQDDLDPKKCAAISKGSHQRPLCHQSQYQLPPHGSFSLGPAHGSSHKDRFRSI